MDQYFHGPAAMMRNAIAGQQASKPAVGAGPHPSPCPVTTGARVMKPETFIRAANVGELRAPGRSCSPRTGRTSFWGGLAGMARLRRPLPASRRLARRGRDRRLFTLRRELTRFRDPEVRPHFQDVLDHVRRDASRGLARDFHLGVRGGQSTRALARAAWAAILAVPTAIALKRLEVERDGVSDGARGGTRRGGE